MENEERVVRLAKPVRKGPLRLIFSRFFIIALLLLLQVAIVIGAYVFFTDKLPVLVNLQWVFSLCMVVYLFNCSMDSSAKLTWMFLIAILPLPGAAFFLFTQSNFDPGERNKYGIPQKIEYICKDGLNVYKPGFAIFGFRYAKLEADVDLDGASFTATVQSISDKPAEDGAYGSVGTSYYPVTCIADDADVELNVGEYCGVTLSGESESDTLYLQLPFVRSDSGGSYVLAERDGRLEKRYVATGGYLWGNYVEIRSGLTWDDAIAFPYGRTAREGNRAQQADISELYNY